jgi:hypothetical protein
VLMNESQAGAHEADYDGESPVPIIWSLLSENFGEKVGDFLETHWSA